MKHFRLIEIGAIVISASAHIIVAIVLFGLPSMKVNAVPSQPMEPIEASSEFPPLFD